MPGLDEEERSCNYQNLESCEVRHGWFFRLFQGQTRSLRQKVPGPIGDNRRKLTHLFVRTAWAEGTLLHR